MNKQDISFTEYRRRFFEWLFHYTTIEEQYWNIPLPWLHNVYDLGVDPKDAAQEAWSPTGAF